MDFALWQKAMSGVVMLLTQSFPGGQAARISDVGDAIQTTFTIPASTCYQLNLRVRAGDAGSRSSYFNEGYLVQLDGNEISMTGDLGSIVQETKAGVTDVYWGVMNCQPLYIAAGSHTLSVAAKRGYARVDCLEVKRLGPRW